MVLIADDQLDKLHVAAMWRVNFDHFTAPVGFVTCSELQATAQKYRYAQGGDMIGEEFIGGFEFGDLTLERGQDENMEMQNWWDAICNVTKGTAAVPSSYKHDGELILLNLDGTEGMTWDMHKTFIGDFKAAGGMDANNKTANIVTSMVLSMKWWKYRA